MTRLAVAARLVHPFPSILDGTVVALVALLAGGSAVTAGLLGLSMTLLQFSIGALNDLVDAPRDAGRKPGKPIPAGLVTPPAARLVVVTSATAGLVLALSGGPGVLLLAGIGLAIGFAYDLRAKGTTLSWLPFAVGIPILPVYGWLGATGSLPALFVGLVPAAAIEGAALAIANSIVDLERDEIAGAGSVARAIGPERAGALVLGLQLVVAVLAIATAVALEVPRPWLVAVLVAACVPLGGAVLGLVAGRGDRTGVRELAWDVQAMGAGLLAVSWLGALSAAAGRVGA